MHSGFAVFGVIAKNYCKILLVVFKLITKRLM